LGLFSEVFNFVFLLLLAIVVLFLFRALSKCKVSDEGGISVSLPSKIVAGSDEEDEMDAVWGGLLLRGKGNSKKDVDGDDDDETPAKIHHKKEDKPIEDQRPKRKVVPGVACAGYTQVWSSGSLTAEPGSKARKTNTSANMKQLDAGDSILLQVEQNLLALAGRDSIAQVTPAKVVSLQEKVHSRLTAELVMMYLGFV
jgi:hypothetical protein